MVERKSASEKVLCGSSRSVKHGAASSVSVRLFLVLLLLLLVPFLLLCVSVAQRACRGKKTTSAWKRSQRVHTVSEQRVDERNGNRHPFVGDRVVGNNSNTNNKSEAEGNQDGEETRNEEEDKRGEERLQSDERSLKSVQWNKKKNQGKSVPETGWEEAKGGNGYKFDR